MPELPQMQALAERIDAALNGATLTSIQPLQFASLKTVSPPPDSLHGRTLEAVTRRGKFLVLTFGDVRMLLHLSQGGRVVFEDPPKTTRPKQGVLRARFDRAPALFVREYGTERKAAWWVTSRDDDGPLGRLGPEPDAEAFDAYLRSSEDTRRIHTILRDQRTVAGIGRGYADDVLHRARLSPYTSLAVLTHEQRAELAAAITAVLADALEAERGRVGGLPPKLSDHFTVHARYGRPCPVCGDDLRRVSYESHEVTYCPTCQTGGKVLADRRMSRLVR